jgi:hypothetical protein
MYVDTPDKGLARRLQQAQALPSLEATLSLMPQASLGVLFRSWMTETRAR